MTTTPGLRTAICATLLTCLCAHADADPSAAQHELMQGFPPPPEQRVNRKNFMAPPYNRWSLQHIRELLPTREIYRGSGPVAVLQEEPLALGEITGTVRAGRELSLDQFLAESHTDAFVVLHGGKLVFERYLNGMQAHTQHQMFSVTKSLVGTLMLVLMAEGAVDASKPVSHYLPELADSGFGDATVAQVMDMTNGIRFAEVYDDPYGDFQRYGIAIGAVGHPPDSYKGPRSLYEFLPTLRKQGEHGRAFLYASPNTDVLAWIISRVTGQSLSRNFEERFWQPLGTERDAYLWLDRAGTEMAGGGLSATPRDLARFGQMILQQGNYNGKQVIPASVAARILAPGNAEVFGLSYPGEPWYGEVAHSYHDQWWTFNNAHKSTAAIGIHGQYIYLDPVADLVIVKQSSSPDAEGGANDANDEDGPMLYQAIAEELLRRQRRPQ